MSTTKPALFEILIKASKNKAKQIFDQCQYPVSMFEKNKQWFVAILAAKNEIKNIEQKFGKSMKIKKLPQKNWVEASLKNLPPIHAGRFFIYGNHHAQQAKNKKYAIKIEATTAFGSGHHETTMSCLQMLDEILTHKNINTIYDIGTGTAILALAAAKAGVQNIIATDIDAQAIKVAKQNSRQNNIKNNIQFFLADGFNNENLAKQKPADLILANIVANELKNMAKQFCQKIKDSGYIILSGILQNQKNDVIDIYAQHKMILKKEIANNDWTTLLLQKHTSPMLQNFEPLQYNNSNLHLAALRALMKKNKWQAVLVPHNDEQRNEYLPANMERLATLTGFTGSYGTALITTKKAALFVDGRYIIQANQQVNSKKFIVKNIAEQKPFEWFKKNSTKYITLDPWLHSFNEITQWQKCAKIKFAKRNFIDEIWHNRPPATNGTAHIHPLKFSGKSMLAKINSIKKIMQKNDGNLYIINDATCVAWAFNIRGSDICHTPIVLARAIIAKNKTILFVDINKFNARNKKILTKNLLTKKIICKPPEQFVPELKRLAKNARLLFDKNKDPYAIYLLAKQAKAKISFCQNLIELPRSIKNKIEIAGTRQAHIQDGAAICTFLCWLAQQKIGTVDEISAAKKLENIRRKIATHKMPLRDISFDSISATGKNGAIVHYRVDENSNAKLKNNNLYLIDSGGQYDSGTTDITRTLAIGKPSKRQIDIFTRVLKGHIAIQCAKFAKGTSGQKLDMLARMPLWQIGLDFQHGTGHGVGSYLSVHEPPASISPTATAILHPGQIISNEPGYYCQNKFGIRIENLMLVKKSRQKNMLEFENLTWAPIDKNLINVTMLANDELKWLNNYHASVFKKLAKLLDNKTRNWLAKATSPLKHSRRPLAG